MSDQFVAEIRMFAGNFAPTGWALCNGQIMSIAQNTALFSLLGTTYGGNGQTTFALPNLQGAAPMQPGQGPGLSLHVLGETAGSDTVTLIDSQNPSHTHALAGDTGSEVSTSWEGHHRGRKQGDRGLVRREIRLIILQRPILSSPHDPRGVSDATKLVHERVIPTIPSMLVGRSEIVVVLAGLTFGHRSSSS